MLSVDVGECCEPCERVFKIVCEQIDVWVDIDGLVVLTEKSKSFRRKVHDGDLFDYF